MACPICWKCASCKWKCDCWFRSSQVRIVSTIYRNTSISRNDEINKSIIEWVLWGKKYDEIKEEMKIEWYVFTDDYKIKKQSWSKKKKEIIHEIYKEWCFNSVNEWADKLWIPWGMCEYDWLWSRSRCKHCNSLKFYQGNNTCLAITNNLCEDAASKTTQ